jgi:hypothetical protein
MRKLIGAGSKQEIRIYAGRIESSGHSWGSSCPLLCYQAVDKVGSLYETTWDHSK